MYAEHANTTSVSNSEGNTHIMTSLTTYILPPLIIAAAGLLLALLAYVTTLVRERIKNTVLAGIVDRATHDLSAVVAEYMHQADGLRDPATGALNPSSLAELKASVIARFRSMWGDAGLKELVSVLGFDTPSFAMWLSAHVGLLLSKAPRALPDPAVPATAAERAEITTALHTASNPATSPTVVATASVPSIVLVDVDGMVTPSELALAASALQRQVIEHFFPAYNLIATVRAATAKDPAHPDERRLELRRVPTMPDALGFHDLGGMYVFPELDADDGVPWTVTASHEILETLADPLLRRATQDDEGRFWAFEICDAVERDAYKIDAVAVSNFILPAWGEPSPGSNRFDYLGRCSTPWEILPGGYGQVWSGIDWTQVGTRRGAREKLKELGVSRSARRRGPSHQAARRGLRSTGHGR